MINRATIIFVMTTLLLNVKSSLAVGFPNDLPLYYQEHRSEETVAGIDTAVLDYQGLKEDTLTRKLIESLEKQSPSLYSSSPQAAKAFWINAYNFGIIQLVLTFYPIKSLQELTTFNRKALKRHIFTLEGDEYTPDYITRHILPDFEDPRILMALCNAAASSPDFPDNIFTAENIDKRLDELARRFLANPSKGMRVDTAAGVVYLSEIFDSQAPAFAKMGGIKQFLQRYAPQKFKRFLAEQKYGIRYMPFRWQLNDRPKSED